MDNLRIDQSHCNYYLTRWIELQGGVILFKDAGRVTRGGMGNQGRLLNIFESNGLPIPDIVALLYDDLFIIEIDTNIKKASKSLIKYETFKPLLDRKISSEINGINFKRLNLAFCFTGLKTEDFIKSLLLSKEIPCEYLFAFTAPRMPLLIDLRSGPLEN